MRIGVISHSSSGLSQVRVFQSVTAITVGWSYCNFLQYVRSSLDVYYERLFRKNINTILLSMIVF